MSWKKETEELARKRLLAQAQGGAEGIARQHAKGFLTVRERTDALLDPGSFQEIGGASGDAVRDDEGNFGLIRQLSQIDLQVFALVMACHESWNHSRIKGGAMATDQGDETVWLAARVHDPFPQQQCMAVPSSGQHQMACHVWLM